MRLSTSAIISVFPENYYINASSVLTFKPAVARHLCLDPVKCTEGRQIRSTAALSLCCVASQLMRSAIHSTCKSFLAPLFMLLIVPYNSVYYNYITIMQWLVGWFWDQGKKGVCIGKKVHCDSNKSALNCFFIQIAVCI